MADNFDLASILGDLKSDVFEHKMNCARRLGMIALAVGPEKTRKEFLPLLKSMYFYYSILLNCIFRLYGYRC
jgi:hypothetical protein